VNEVAIEELLAEEQSHLALVLRAGRAGLHRVIKVPRIQKPGLALTGYEEQLHDQRLLVLGGTEVEYLESATGKQRQLGIETTMNASPAGIAITRGLEPPQELVASCDKAGVPLMVSQLGSAEFIGAVTRFLQRRLSPSTTVHGVLVDVLGVGILLRGKSGIGKSEAALDLLVRGHQLVADDVVEVQRLGPNLIIGSAAEVIRHHMEIRGLGIINIKDLFGISSIRESKQIDLVAELVEWHQGVAYERLGVDDEYYRVLGEELPLICIPIRPGRNLATIIEVAARNQLLKRAGHHSARVFQAALHKRIAPGVSGSEQSS